jgi:hypothetical protein
MQITKEFLEAEIRDLEAEAQKAQIFLTQAQATVQAYKMLINRLDAPEEDSVQEGAEHVSV